MPTIISNGTNWSDPWWKSYNCFKCVILMKGWSEIYFNFWESWCVFSVQQIRTRGPNFAKYIVILITVCRWEVIEFLSTWILQFHCCSSVGISHECSFLCSIVQFLKFCCDVIGVTYKLSEFMNSYKFTIQSNIGWGVIQCAMDSAFMDFSICFSRTAPFIFMLTTIKEVLSNHIF